MEVGRHHCHRLYSHVCALLPLWSSAEHQSSERERVGRKTGRDTLSTYSYLAGLSFAGASCGSSGCLWQMPVRRGARNECRHTAAHQAAGLSLGKQGFFKSIEEKELAFGLLCLLRGTRGGQRMCRRAGRGVRHLVVSPQESVLPGPVLSPRLIQGCSRLEGDNIGPRTRRVPASDRCHALRVTSWTLRRSSTK